MDWEVTRSVATIASTSLVALGLFLSYRAFKQNARGHQLQVLWNVYKELKELDREYIESFDDKSPEAKTAWSSTFFNLVECLCFIVNHRLTLDSELKAFFFEDALPAWMKMFKEHVQGQLIKDGPATFKEFKRAYRASAGRVDSS